MPDDFVLRDRLYEAVLELAGIPRSQLDMLLSVPDPVQLAKSIRRLILNKEVDHAVGKGATVNR
jgi:hypothetical protein